MARTRVEPFPATRVLAFVGLGWVLLCWALLGIAWLVRGNLPDSLVILGYSKYGGSHESITGTDTFFLQSSIVLAVATVLALTLVLVAWRVPGITVVVSILLCAMLPSVAGVLVVTLGWQLGMSARPTEVPFGIWALGLVGLAAGLIAGFTSAYLFFQRADNRANSEARREILARRRR